MTSTAEGVTLPKSAKSKMVPPTRIELVIFACAWLEANLRGFTSGTSATRYHCAIEAETTQQTRKVVRGFER